MPQVVKLSDINPDEIKVEFQPKTISLVDLNPDEIKVEPSMSPLESAAHGAGQGASFGFSDEIYGAGRALMDSMARGGKSFGESYPARRDEYRKTLGDAEKSSPTAYRIGNAGGAIGSAFVPGLNALNVGKGASLLGNIGKAAVGGGIAGAGYSKGDLTEGGVPELASDIGQGAAIGGAFQGVLQGAGNLFGKASPSSLRGAAERRAVKAVTGNSIKNIRKAARMSADGGDLNKGLENLQKVGRDLIDDGAVTFGSSVEKSSEVVGKLRDKIGKDIGKVGNAIDEYMPDSISGKEIADEMLNFAAKVPETGGGTSIQNRIIEEASLFEKAGNISFDAANKAKQSYKYKATAPDALISSQDASNALKNIVSKKMEEVATKIASEADDVTKKAVEQYKNLKGKYGSMAFAKDATSDVGLKEISNRFASPSDYGTGAAFGLAASIGTGGVSIPAIATAALATGANKLARERGSAAAAITLDKIAKIMDKSPKFAKAFGQAFINAGKKGPEALVLTHQTLLSNPEYKKAFDKTDKNYNTLKLPQGSEGIQMPGR